ncbi:MAG: DEAD/DEAH box helicase [Chitinophagales bacterium]|nr:DEAD/DEAH box helicase [Chitinophagales bacterium]
MKTKTQYALMLNPDEICLSNNVLCLLHITYSDAWFDYYTTPLTTRNIRTLKKYGFGADAIRSLMPLTEEYLHAYIKGEQIASLKQRSGQAREVVNRRIEERILSDFLREVAQHESINIYHRRLTDKGRCLLSKCKLKAEPPSITFRVLPQSEGRFQIETIIHTDEGSAPLSEFEQKSFLLLRNHTYYLLHIKELQTLRWLQSKSTDGGWTGAALAEHILAELERNYHVDRGKYLRHITIHADPKGCVHISELNEKFLMLTPQWNYEGIMVEGEYCAEQEITLNGQLYKIIRNREAEERLTALVRALHPAFQTQHRGYFYLTFEEAQKKNWFLRAYVRLLEMDIELRGLDMLHHFRYSPQPPVTEFKLTAAEDDRLYFDMKVRFGNESVPLREIKKVLMQGQHCVMLRNGTIGVLDDGWLQQYEVLVRHATITTGAMWVHKWLLLAENASEAVRKYRPVFTKEWLARWEQWQQHDTEVYSLPRSLHADLRPYQRKGYEWLRLLSAIGSGACLADDMGLGKTLQSIAFIAAELENYADARCIIVSPLTLLENWRREFQKFCPSINTYIFHGKSRDPEEFLQSGAPVMLISYHTLRSAINDLSTIHWHVALIDESHHIKNPSAKITQAVCALKARHRIILTGTPLLNSTLDLHSQFHFILPGYLGSRETFNQDYVIPIERLGNHEKVHELRQITRPFILRRTKSQVAQDLPPKIETLLWCEMDEEQRQVYEEIKKQIRDSVFLSIKNVGIAKSKLNILQGIIRLRQVCCSAAMAKGIDLHSEQSVKIDVLSDKVQNELSDKKILVFSQFIEMLRLIRQRLNRDGLHTLYIDGESNPAQRKEAIDRFQDDEAAKVFLLSLKVGNAGINLTAAEYVFLTDPWWNTAIQQQAIDRTHRIGQNKTVFVYQMLCRNSIEEKILDIQQHKKRLADELIPDEEGFVKNLTVEELEYLFA